MLPEAGTVVCIPATLRANALRSLETALSGRCSRTACVACSKSSCIWKAFKTPSSTPFCKTVVALTKTMLAILQLLHH